MTLTYDALQAELGKMPVFSPTSVKEQAWIWTTAKQIARKFPNRNIVECGTMNGKVAIIMAHAVRCMQEEDPDIKTKVLAVDNYHDQSKNTQNIHSHEQNQQLAIDFGYEGILEFINGDDIEFINALPDCSLGGIYIDSWHVYKHVYSTLNAVLPKMGNNGIICLHDYAFCECGVVYAVDDFMKEQSKYVSGFAVYGRICWLLARTSTGKKAG